MHVVQCLMYDVCMCEVYARWVMGGVCSMCNYDRYLLHVRVQIMMSDEGCMIWDVECMWCGTWCMKHDAYIKMHGVYGLMYDTLMHDA